MFHKPWPPRTIFALDPANLIYTAVDTPGAFDNYLVMRRHGVHEGSLGARFL